MKIARLLAAVLTLSVLASCAPTRNTGPLLDQKATYNLNVDNSGCQGTYRNVFIYRNNVILGQVQDEPRVFVDIAAGSADFKAAPTLGNSKAIQKTFKLDSNITWRVCE